MYVCVYVCVCVCMCVYVCVCLCVCVCVCESEVVTWILSIPLDYVLVKVVDGDAEVSETACVLF